MDGQRGTVDATKRRDDCVVKIMVVYAVRHQWLIYAESGPMNLCPRESVGVCIEMDSNEYEDKAKSKKHRANR